MAGEPWVPGEYDDACWDQPDWPTLSIEERLRKFLAYEIEECKKLSESPYNDGFSEAVDNFLVYVLQGWHPLTNPNPPETDDDSL